MYFYIILVHNYTTLPQPPSFTSQNSLFDRSWNHKRARCRLHRLDIWAVDKLVISQSFIGVNWRSTWVYKPPNDTQCLNQAILEGGESLYKSILVHLFLGGGEERSCYLIIHQTFIIQVYSIRVISLGMILFHDSRLLDHIFYIDLKIRVQKKWVIPEWYPTYSDKKNI